MNRISEIFEDLRPYILDLLSGMGISSSGISSSTLQHELSGPYHTGSLADDQAPQFLLTTGGAARPLSGNLYVNTNITIDGVDIDVLGTNFATHIGGSARAQHAGGLGDHTHQSAGAEGGKLDHGLALNGLTDDDHTIYLLASGARALTGNMSVNNGVTIDGVDISAHAAGTARSQHTAGVGDHTHQSSGAEGATLDHGLAMTAASLLDDDHTRYFDKDGSKAATGNFSTMSLIPIATDTYDLGTSLLLWRKGYLSELDTLIFAQQTIQILGGWEIIGHDEGTFEAGVAAGDNHAVFTNRMTANDFILSRGMLMVEYMQIGALNGSVVNKVPNPSAEVNLDGIDTVPGSNTLVVTRDGTYATKGLYSYRSAFTFVSGTSDLRWWDLAGARIPVTQALSYTWSLYFRTITFSTGANFVLGVVWYNSSNGIISTSTSTARLLTNYQGAFTRVENAWTAPTGAVTAIPFIRYGVANSNSCIDGVQFEQASYASVYADGRVDYCEWTGTADASTTRRASTASWDYLVTRNLDGSGANNWPKGTPYLILGNTGDGRIELNATDTPRISLIKQGATYNAQTELVRIGDLNAGWGYSAEAYGLAFGEYAASKPNITIDSTNGLRIRSYTTDILTLGIDGSAYFAGPMTIGTSGGIYQGTGTFASPTTGLKIYNSGGVGRLVGYNAGVEQIVLDTDGRFKAGGSNIVLDATGLWLAGVTYLDPPGTVQAALKFGGTSAAPWGWIVSSFSGGNWIQLDEKLETSYPFNVIKIGAKALNTGHAAALQIRVTDNEGASVSTSGDYFLAQGPIYEYITDAQRVYSPNNYPVRVDTYANLVGSVPAEGRLAWPSDTHALGISDGSAWLFMPNYGTMNWAPWQGDPSNITATTFAMTASLYRKVWVFRWTQPCYVASNNNGSNYWSFELRNGYGSNLASFNTSGLTAGVWSLLTSSLNLWLYGANTVQESMYYIVAIKVGSPGQLQMYTPEIIYRMFS